MTLASSFWILLFNAYYQRSQGRQGYSGNSLKSPLTQIYKTFLQQEWWSKAWNRVFYPFCTYLSQTYSIQCIIVLIFWFTRPGETQGLYRGTLDKPLVLRSIAEYQGNSETLSLTILPHCSFPMPRLSQNKQSHWRSWSFPQEISDQ